MKSTHISEDEVISIDTVMQRMANSLHMEWQKILKAYSKIYDYDAPWYERTFESLIYFEHK